MNGFTGTLAVVATPIGNLEDITLRALRVLRECDAVVAEELAPDQGIADGARRAETSAVVARIR